MPSITVPVNNLQQVGPVMEVIIAPSMQYLQAMGIVAPNVRNIKVWAMIDTGATLTVIKKGLAESLGLHPISVELMNTPSHVNQRCHQYDVQLIFPNNVVGVSGIIVTEASLQNQHIQCLIGRDILSQGILIYSGYTNTFSLSF